MSYNPLMERVKVVAIHLTGKTTGEQITRYGLAVNGEQIGPLFPSDSSLDDIRLWFVNGGMEELFVHWHVHDRPMDFSALQTSTGAWTIHNFGNQDAIEPLLGICEEAGELCAAHLIHDLNAMENHKDIMADPKLEWLKQVWLIAAQAHMGAIAHSHLKTRQGIRGDSSVHEANALKSLGHLVHCLFQYFGMAEMLKVIVDVSDYKQTVMDFDVDTPADAIADLTVFASNYCNVSQIDYQTAVETTWAKVSKRDFKLYPGNGLPPIPQYEGGADMANGNDETVITHIRDNGQTLMEIHIPNEPDEVELVPRMQRPTFDKIQWNAPLHETDNAPDLVKTDEDEDVEEL